jgi:hypothetical protein
MNQEIKNKFKATFCGVAAALGFTGLIVFGTHAAVYAQALSLIPTAICGLASLAFIDLMFKTQDR